MIHQIAGRRIENVAVVDDVPSNRATLAAELRLQQFSPRVFDGPYHSIPELVAHVSTNADAVICDFNFTDNYVHGNGAEAVSSWYDIAFPAILTTAYKINQSVDIRRVRDKIPVIMEQAEPEYEIERALEICIEEIEGNYLPERRPWRSLFRVVHVSGDERNRLVDIIIPGWDAHQAVTIPLELFPDEYHQYIAEGERFFAKINVGVENRDDLFFTQMEYYGPFEA